MKALPCLLLAAIFVTIQYRKWENTRRTPASFIFDSVTLEVKNGVEFDLGKGWFVHAILFDGLKKNRFVTLSINGGKYLGFYGVSGFFIIDQPFERFTLEWK